MSIKLNFLRRLLVNSIYAIGFTTMFIFPIYFMVLEVYKHIEFQGGNKIQLNWALFAILFLIGFAILYIKYFRKWFYRKLSGLQVRDELGIMPVKGILGIISDRLLRTLEYVYPFSVTLLILYIGKYLFPQYEIFVRIYDMNIFLIYLSAAGFGIFLIGDFVKLSMMKQQEVINKLNLGTKVNKLELKKLKVQNKNALRALAIEKELEDLKLNSR